jgi:hypothetical protein
MPPARDAADSRSRRAPPLRRRSIATWKRAALVLLIAIGPLLAAEIGLRIMIATGRLPVAVAHSGQFELTWANLHRREQWDVLLLGDSTTQEGINPAVIGEILSAEIGHETAVFDGAVPGSKILLNTTMARELDREGRLPRIVVLGIQPGWLGGNGEFENFFIKTPMGRIATHCSYETTYEGIVSCRAEEISVLWRMRGRVTTLLQAIDHPLPTSMRGRGGKRASLLGPDGFRSADGTSDEALTNELNRRERRGQLHDFHLLSAAAANFTALATFLRDRGVAVFAVSIPNIPPLQERLDRLYPGWADRYAEGLDQLEAMSGVRIVRPQIDSWFTPADAHNAKHLSRRGADHFTRMIMEVDWVRELMVSGLERADVSAADGGDSVAVR